MLVCFLSQNLVCLSLLVIPHRKEGNSDSIIGQAKKLKFDLFSAFLIFVFFISVIVLATATFTKVVHFIVLFFLQTRRESKFCYLEGSKNISSSSVLLFVLLLTVFGRGS